MRNCVYSCQGKMECFEGFTNGPAPAGAGAPKGPEFCGDFDKSGNLVKSKDFKCGPGLFCMQRDDYAYPVCTTADYRDDINIKTGDRACSFSGAGIKDCVMEKSDTNCGPLSNTRCTDGMFCTAEGKCSNFQPLLSENCNTYSGVGIKGCRRRVSTDMKCGPLAKHRICPANFYCSNGDCVEKKPATSDELCMRYSGDNMSCGASLVAPAPAPALLRRTPAPAPTPALRAIPAPSTTKSNFASFPNKKWDVDLRKTTTTKTSQSTPTACLADCEKNKECVAFYHKPPQDCTLYTTKFPVKFNTKTNIDQYSKRETGSTIGYYRV